MPLNTPGSRDPFVIAGRTILEELATERHPIIEVTGWNKIDTLNIIGDDDMSFHRGSKPKEIKIEGDCDLEDKRFLESLTSFDDRDESEDFPRSEPVSMQSHRGDYDILIKTIITKPTGRREPSISSLVYTYTINCISAGARVDS